jgi:hypothetical protein
LPVFVARASSPVLRCKNTPSPALSEANGMVMPPGMFDVRIHRKNREGGATRHHFSLDPAAPIIDAPPSAVSRTHSRFKIQNEENMPPRGRRYKTPLTRRLPEVLEPTTIVAGARLAPCRGCKR